MQKSFKFGVTTITVGILVAGVVTSMNFGAISAEAQTTIHDNHNNLAV